MVEVTQADRNFAAPWIAQSVQSFSERSAYRKEIEAGEHDAHPMVIAAAAHRIEAVNAERDRLPSPFGALREVINSDPDYAWSWLCNLAVPIMDSAGVTHEIANQTAALIMAQMFGCDITKHPNFEYVKSPQQGYFEARVASERNSNGGKP